MDLGGYGEPKGLARCASWCATCWPSREIAVSADQVLLTHGSSQAMDLVARRLAFGDAVLVDDPGYPNMLFSLRFLGARLIGVPRTPAGYDLAGAGVADPATPSQGVFHPVRLQSPTGSVVNLAHLHRVVQLVEKHHITVVENDIYADLDPEPCPSLASLDQLQRVVYISSFPNLVAPTSAWATWPTARPAGRLSSIRRRRITCT